MAILNTTLANAQLNPPSDSTVRKRLENYVQKKKAPGIVVGVVDEKGSRVFGWGVVKKGETNEVNGDTLFEIGSITKTFTASLLQEMVDRGEVRLDDPIAKYLPSWVKTPSRNGKQITLLDLATHTSGLPRLPGNLSTWHVLTHADNPYADYTVTNLYEFLSSYKLSRDIGAKYEYSNIGFGLLGHLLALRAGTNYETLAVTLICEPLGMDSTGIKLSAALSTRMAHGHSESGKPVPNWDQTAAIEGCGALRSSANDMLKFLAANMGFGNPRLTDAMKKTQAPRHETELGQQVALAWHVNTDGIVWHNGGTGGYRSFIGFSPLSHRGVVLLANSANDVDDLALWAIGPASHHTVAKIDPAVYQRYVGKYKLAPGATITIIREGDQLFAQLTGQDRIEFFPEAETEFFCKVVDAQLIFTREGDEVKTVTLRQAGFDQKAPKEK
jgi:CubicO group peptidase (beta-lactamase class C family)